MKNTGDCIVMFHTNDTFVFNRLPLFSAFLPYQIFSASENRTVTLHSPVPCSLPQQGEGSLKAGMILAGLGTALFADALES